MTLRLRIWLSTLAVCLLPSTVLAQHYAGHAVLAPVALEARHALGDLRWDPMLRVAVLMPPFADAGPSADAKQPQPPAADPVADVIDATSPQFQPKPAVVPSVDAAANKKAANKKAADKKAAAKKALRKAAERKAAELKAAEFKAAELKAATEQAAESKAGGEHAAPTAPARVVSALDQCPGWVGDDEARFLSGYVMTEPADLAAAVDPAIDQAIAALAEEEPVDVSPSVGSGSPVIVTLTQSEEYLPYDFAALDRLRLQLFPYGLPSYCRELLMAPLQVRAAGATPEAQVHDDASASPGIATAANAPITAAPQNGLPVDCLLDDLVWRAERLLADDGLLRQRLRPYELGRRWAAWGQSSASVADRWVGRLAAVVAPRQAAEVGPPAPPAGSPDRLVATAVRKADAPDVPSVCCPVDSSTGSPLVASNRSTAAVEGVRGDLGADVLRSAADSLEALAAAMRSLSDQLDQRRIASKPVAGPHVR